MENLPHILNKVDCMSDDSILIYKGLNLIDAMVMVGACLKGDPGVFVLD